MVWPSNLCFNQPPGDLHTNRRLRTTAYIICSGLCIHPVEPHSSFFLLAYICSLLIGNTSVYSYKLSQCLWKMCHILNTFFSLATLYWIVLTMKKIPHSSFQREASTCFPVHLVGQGQGRGEGISDSYCSKIQGWQVICNLVSPSQVHPRQGPRGFVDLWFWVDTTLSLRKAL